MTNDPTTDPIAAPPSGSAERLFGVPPEDGPVSGCKLLLNIGCGAEDITLPPGLFPAEEWREVRLDIDPSVRPDILASITDMAPVPDASIDAVWSSHNFEHLFQHEVSQAARECLRVLKPGGRLLISVPDLKPVAEAILAGRLDLPLYESPAGPISAHDMLYGYGAAIAAGHHYMAHRTGFTQESLGRVLFEAGFDPVMVNRPSPYDLAALAFRPPVPAEILALHGLLPTDQPSASDTASKAVP